MLKGNLAEGRMQIRHAVSCIGLCSVLLLQASLGYGQQARPASPPVPSWVAWKVFQDSLVFYDKKASQDTRKMLKEKFGLSPAQASKLLTAGQLFLADL